MAALNESMVSGANTPKLSDVNEQATIHGDNRRGVLRTEEVVAGIDGDELVSVNARQGAELSSIINGYLQVVTQCWGRALYTKSPDRGISIARREVLERSLRH